MTGYSRNLTTAVHAGENAAIWIPKGPLSGKRPVILCHGWEQAASEFYLPSQAPAASALADSIAAAGFPVIAGDFGGTLTNDPAFGNAMDSSRVEEARLYMNSLGCKADKALFVGISMGNLTAWAHARDYAGKQTGIVSIIPASDLTAIYTNNRLNTQAQIGSAWGVAYPAALPANADPNLNYNNLPVLPYHCYYSAADTVVLPAEVTALATKLGGSAAQVSTSAPHGDTAVAAVDKNDLITFLKSIA